MWLSTHWRILYISLRLYGLIHVIPPSLSFWQMWPYFIVCGAPLLLMRITTFLMFASFSSSSLLGASLIAILFAGKFSSRHGIFNFGTIFVYHDVSRTSFSLYTVHWPFFRLLPFIRGRHSGWFSNIRTEHLAVFYAGCTSWRNLLIVG